MNLVLFPTVETFPEVILLEVVWRDCSKILILFHGFKMRYLEMILHDTEEEEAARNEIWLLDGLLQVHHKFFCRNLLEGENCLRVCIVMKQDPLLGNQFWPHTTNQLYQMFQNLEIKLVVDSLTRWDKLLALYPFAVK
jgi:hypothetical protein